MKYPNIEEIIKKIPNDPRLFLSYSDWVHLYTPPEGNELDWIREGEEDFAVAFNEYFLDWMKLSDEQKEAVDRFAELMLGWKYSTTIKLFEDNLQVSKECLEYDAPLGTIDLEKEIW